MTVLVLDTNAPNVKFQLPSKCFEVRLDARSFPEVIALRSAKTGRVVRFVQDHYAAECAEWWDGELYEYRLETPGEVPSRLRVVAYLQLFP